MPPLVWGAEPLRAAQNLCLWWALLDRSVGIEPTFTYQERCGNCLRHEARML